MQVDEEVNSMHLKMEYRRDLFLIYKESINNSAKHSGCSRVKVIIKIKNRDLSMQIVDNGKGIDMAAAESGNGLTNIRRRASAIKGEIIIHSGSEGTAITLNVPVSVIT
jgi:signal transduction histidine kinase